MATSYLQITKQIEKLKAEAATVRAVEVSGVVSRINEAIAVYGITPADLVFGGKAKPTSASTTQKPGRGNGVVKKYADGSGNTWSGRGPRPHWLRDMLNAGADISKFVVTGNSVAAPAKPALTPVVKPKTKWTVPTKFRDPATGNAWSGRGTKPTWLRTALDAGRSLEEFTVAAAAPAAANGAASSAKNGAVVKKAKAKASKAAVPNRRTRDAMEEARGM